MRGFDQADHRSSALELLILLAIVSIGFALRYYRVGKDSFWLDEAAQALAAIQPRITDTLAIIRQHAAAMPLDYLVSRFVASFTLDEKFMRFPSVIWGTLSVLVFFFLVCELDIPHGRLVAIAASALLAFSPVHVQYSQEMRFYAALGFFYLASTHLLVRAVKTPSIRNWIFYTLLTLLGEYFHPFVLFTVITGFILVLGARFFAVDPGQPRLPDRADLSKFAICSLILAGLYVPGYLFFNSGQTFSSDLSFHLDVIMQGLGLRATRLESGLGPFGVWHILLLVGAIGGLFLVARRVRRYRLVLCLLIAFILQFALIVGLDAYRRYFFSGRQIIHLAPLLLLLVAIFVVECAASIEAPRIKWACAAVILGVICTFSLPYTKAIYDYSKGSAGEIAQVILSQYQPDQEVLVLPGSYGLILDFYFHRYQRSGRPPPAILTTNDLEDLAKQVAANPTVEYVVTARETSGDVRKSIMRLGFRAASVKPAVDFLFTRSP